MREDIELVTAGEENLSELRMLSSDYRDRFGGVGRLFGRAALDRLQASHVCLFGIGGVGSWAVEGLARSGVGAITLVDLDDVCITNVNRQLPAIDGQIGRPKVVVMKERIHAINPDCRVETVTEYFTPKTAEALLVPRFDVVIDAIDKMSNKALLIASCSQRGLSCVTVGAAGGKRDATRICAGDLGEAWGDNLLRLVRRKLRRDHGFPVGEDQKFGVRCVYSAEQPVFPWTDGSCRMQAEPGTNLTLDCESGFGTAVFVTGAFGLVAAQEAIRLLIAQITAPIGD